MDHAIAFSEQNYPSFAPMLEEVAVAGVGDQASALSFACSRLPEEDRRPCLLLFSRTWLIEQGCPYAQGLALSGRALLYVLPRTAADALWAMEQALRSGAVAAAIGVVEQASFTQTRRLDFAAREGGSIGMLLRRNGGGLSAARRRWRVSRLPSAGAAFDAGAPGGTRLLAELVRRRDGPPGAWILEQSNATDRFRLADRLADHGLVAHGRTVFAA